MRIHKKVKKYVYCVEDEKYGLLAVYTSKKAAERAYKEGKWEWRSGYGGDIFKHEVMD